MHNNGIKLSITSSIIFFKNATKCDNFVNTVYGYSPCIFFKMYVLLILIVQSNRSANEKRDFT